MSIFSKIFNKRPKEGSAQFRLEAAKENHGRVIRYVTERINENDNVVGRGGALTLKDGNFIIDNSADRLYVAPATETDISKLMSGDGVVVKGKNTVDGKYHIYTVYFVYYR